MPDFQTAFDPAYGQAVPVADAIVRVTAPNASPFTFRGTNTYIVGRDRPVVVDPGPADASHRAAIEAACGGRPVAAILLTHTHRDHSALAADLAARLGAPIVGSGPHRPSRPPRDGEAERLDAAGDADLAFDRVLADGERLDDGDVTIEAVATPGHTANHLAYAVGTDGVLLSGDHVMGWSTSIVAPPDGSMRDYRASLQKLLARADRRYLPGHGGSVETPRAFVRGLIAHRSQRERAVENAVRAGAGDVPTIAARVYPKLDERLRTTAQLSTLAHLEELVEAGRLRVDGAPPLRATYRPA